MRLLAVRHGQASFSAEDYDQLSELGSAQAEALGSWLADHEPRFDRVLCGRLRRHAQTLDGIAAALGRSGHALPPTRIDPRLDEFDHRQLAVAFVRAFPQHPVSLGAKQGRSRDLTALLRLLREALLSWTRDELPEAAESWATFRQRTRSVLTELASGERQSVLLVSSAGVIAQLAAESLELPDHRSIDLNMSLRNSALCELHAGETGIQLRSWNGLPHLADRRSMWTHV
nr:histidine phosphatase family protein [Lysobacter sp. CAU 1642]